MKHTFEPHPPPQQSRLEKWRREIVAMRAQNWPYQRITQWLREEQNFTAESVRYFCKSRKIPKGRRTRLLTPVVDDDDLFHYEGDRPIPIKHDF